MQYLTRQVSHQGKPLIIKPPPRRHFFIRTIKTNVFTSIIQLEGVRLRPLVVHSGFCENFCNDVNENSRPFIPDKDRYKRFPNWTVKTSIERIQSYLTKRNLYEYFIKNSWSLNTTALILPSAGVC